jgi:uncharacterized Zn ribbon protein
MKVRKLKCNDCKTIIFAEYKYPLLQVYSCPHCIEPLEYVDLVVIEESELNYKDEQINELIHENADLINFKDLALKQLSKEQLENIEDEKNNSKENIY